MNTTTTRSSIYHMRICSWPNNGGIGMKMKRTLLFAAGALWTVALCATPIRFGTWNIRLATMDKWEKDPRFPKWEARMPHVTGLIKDKGFDLMGLQEVCTQQADFIRKAFPDWGLVGVATNDAERSRTSHANGIFFRKDRFSVDEWGWFGLSETPDVPGVKSWGTMCVRACTWARMTDRVEDRKFLFFNTHFDHRSQQAREKGMELVLAKIAEKNREGLPVILCGDFNSRVESPQIQLAKKTLSRAFEISATPPKGPFRTDNCWKFVPPERENEKAGNRIDHIFLTPGIKVASHETFGDFYGDNFYPSDHFPMKVLMEWP